MVYGREEMEATGNEKATVAGAYKAYRTSYKTRGRRETVTSPPGAAAAVELYPSTQLGQLRDPSQENAGTL